MSQRNSANMEAHTSSNSTTGTSRRNLSNNFFKVSNAAEYNSSSDEDEGHHYHHHRNNDRDDSLYDAQSLGQQTPGTAAAAEHIDSDINYNYTQQQMSDSFKEGNLKSFTDLNADLDEPDEDIELEQGRPRFSLIDLGFVQDHDENEKIEVELSDQDDDDQGIEKSEKQLSGDGFRSIIKVSDSNPTNDLLNATMDELILVTDNANETTKNQEKPVNASQFVVSKIPTPIRQHRRSLYEGSPETANNISSQQSNINRIRQRVNAITKSEMVELDLDPQQPVDSAPVNQANGAFKLYSGDDNPTKNSTLSDKKSDKNVTESRAQQSPFISIETSSRKQTDNNDKSGSKKASSTRGPIRKYRSGSTSALNVKPTGSKTSTGTDNNDDAKKASLMQRPATQTELIYSIESDESTIVDNLINDPQKLKEKLKQSRMEREQLNQLQQNYLRLLEQYAEAENFIDMFRLGGQMAAIGAGGSSGGTNDPTPNVKMFQGSLTAASITNANKNQLPNNSFIESSASTFVSNQSGGGGGGGTQSRITKWPLTNLTSPYQASNNNNNEQQNNSSESAKNSSSFLPSESVNSLNQLNQASQQAPTPAVIVLARNNGGNSSSFQVNNAATDEGVLLDLVDGQLPSQSPENIVVEQTSKLGILVQSKVLEDKMYSFITLMNEKQLNKAEQKQVYDSIQNEYKNLLRNYDEVKRNDSSGVVQDELEMDIDLNQELSKMKDLLNNIVQKMNDNLSQRRSPTESMLSAERRSSNGTSSASSFGNNDEIMGQYNRLLDVFDNQTERDVSLNNQSSYLDPKSMRQLELLKKSPLKPAGPIEARKNPPESEISSVEPPPSHSINHTNHERKPPPSKSEPRSGVQQANQLKKHPNAAMSELIRSQVTSSSELEYDRKRKIRSPKRGGGGGGGPRTDPETNYNPKNREQMLAHKSRDQFDRSVTSSELDTNNDPSITRIEMKPVRRDKTSPSTAIMFKPANSSSRSGSSHRNYPVARAYEGSDSGEDLDQLNHNEQQQHQLVFENARQTLVANNHLSSTRTRKGAQVMGPREKTVDRKSSSKSRTRVPKSVESVEKIVVYDDDEQYLDHLESASQKRASPSIRINPSQMMTQLAQEVETLKKQILQKHLSKMKSSQSSGTESEKRHFLTNIKLANSSTSPEEIIRVHKAKNKRYPVEVDDKWSDNARVVYRVQRGDTQVTAKEIYQAPKDGIKLKPKIPVKKSPVYEIVEEPVRAKSRREHSLTKTSNLASNSREKMRVYKAKPIQLSYLPLKEVDPNQMRPWNVAASDEAVKPFLSGGDVYESTSLKSRSRSVIQTSNDDSEGDCSSSDENKDLAQLLDQTHAYAVQINRSTKMIKKRLFWHDND